MDLDLFKSRKATSVILLGTSAASLASIPSNQQVCYADFLELACSTSGGILFFILIISAMASDVDNEELFSNAMFLLLGDLAIYVVGIFVRALLTNYTNRQRNFKDSYEKYKELSIQKSSKNYVFDEKEYADDVYPKFTCDEEEKDVIGHEPNYIVCGNYSSLGKKKDCSFGLINERYFKTYATLYEKGYTHFNFRVTKKDKRMEVVDNDVNINVSGNNNAAPIQNSGDNTKPRIFNMFSKKDREFLDEMYASNLSRYLVDNILKAYLRCLMKCNKLNSKMENFKNFEDAVNHFSKISKITRWGGINFDQYDAQDITKFLEARGKEKAFQNERKQLNEEGDYM